MAVPMNQNLGFKFFCRICKKGFGCGRALGGHMRAHGIGDESGHLDHNDGATDWEEYKVGAGGNGSGGGTTTATTTTPPATNKRMYALRTNPNRLRSCRVCENCGKEFSSWKSFLEHGKCASEEAESLVSSPDSEEEEEEEDEEEEEGRGCGGWSKGKRSRRVVKVGIGGAPPVAHCAAASSEEEDLAHCLVLLSTARVEAPVAETESSCASASKEAEERHRVQYPPARETEKAKGAASAPRGLFECKACKKVFNSHQALGGHRASHKKVKGCFAAKLDDGLDDSLVDEDVITHDDYFLGTPSKTAVVPFDHHHHGTDVVNHPSNSMPPTTTSKRKSKVHECSICHRVFASGQALGGHKRCHWVTSNSNSQDMTSTTTSMAKLQQLQQDQHAQTRLQQQRSISQPAVLFNNVINKSEPLDLNLPAPVDEITTTTTTTTTPVLHRDQNASSSTPLQLETALYLQQWIGLHSTGNTNINHINNNNNNDNDDDKNINTTTIINNNVVSLNQMIQVDDEADSKVKLAKLSDLKDINMGGGSSPWLQVGIGSTANGGISDP